jgi:hypothetical protein
MINPLTIIWEFSLLLAEFGTAFFNLINFSLLDILDFNIVWGIDETAIGNIVFLGEWNAVQDLLEDTSLALPFAAVFLNVYFLTGLIALRLVKLYVPLA